VLDERHSRTEGAVEKSKADIAAAEARTSEYELRLREARATLFHAQEARRKAALDARTAAMNEARTKAQQQVQAAKADIEKDRAAAQDASAGASADPGGGNHTPRSTTGRSRPLMILQMASIKKTVRATTLALLAVSLLWAAGPAHAQDQPAPPAKKQPSRDSGRQPRLRPATDARDPRSYRRR